MSPLNTVAEKHTDTLNAAIEAIRNRTYFAHWPEAPSGKIYGETANADGEAAFRNTLDKPFTGLHQGQQVVVGSEESPYGFPLRISYPTADTATLVTTAKSTIASWMSLSLRERACLLVESLERASQRFFEIAYATQHTTGQGFTMAFQASGPHAFDRALEAVATAVLSQESLFRNTEWEKPMGKISVRLRKEYMAIPRGVNVVIGCSTFPVWNSTPGIFAGLVTGNPVIVKPHPGAVYPIAILVSEIQQSLADYGVNPLTIQLGVDFTDAPITSALIEHADVKIIDYTGGSEFGTHVEQIAAANGKVAFTEKAGVNNVIIESADNLDAMLDNIAFSLCLYSGQMCTAPQNVFIPKTGVQIGTETISSEAVTQRLLERIEAILSNPKSGPQTLGAIQNPATMGRIERARQLGLTVLRDSTSISHAGFEGARTATPIVLKAVAGDVQVFSQEWFGPIVFVVETLDADQALITVRSLAQQVGSLSTLVYSTDDMRIERYARELASIGVPVAFNLNSFVWVNQSAGFSDFHGTGANPAGNATFCDFAFVANRYNIVGLRYQL